MRMDCFASLAMTRTGRPARSFSALDRHHWDKPGRDGAA
ncbi:MAG: hypothetical protein OJF48_001136 [Afipia sp.]|nr:MAG: hypothetical protein OJF48_001136 [Afipia sp.]